MAKITINNTCLHEMQMNLGTQDDSTDTLSYPHHRIKLKQNKGGFILKVPTLLAIALYYEGIIPQNKRKSFQISVNNRNIGQFQVEYLKYSDMFYHDDLVEIRLKKHQRTLH